ncbi:2-amino-3-ketobutyrate coenzyme A ligase [Candidatus Bilamarchaeum dharawalense]|uniref:2-amino-3-ketobutyrate coenzyme A ligase n=1 Tax=Candidatus Bilamarchaeum dharawalense TaxID=2885759 RepID=A0A5E4LR79_9ARCH|nr:2-amino-3-ketobutyrate coenzyme A ligase [Candidatus Bilamarchaeum dharawalense]
MNEQLQNDLKAELEDLEQKNLLWNPKTLEGPSCAKAKIAGKDVVMLCSNNYLGLSTNRLLKKAAVEAIRKYGAGSGSVRPIAGSMDLHLKLEETIARFKHTEDALYYNSGFTANSGAIPALLREGDVVISDSLNHGSIIDGVRLTKAERMIYQHRDMAELEMRLKEAQAKNPKRILIITDGVFSMDGDIAPLDQIVKLAQQYGACTYVDDAHGDGVLGENGRGIVSHFKLEGKVDMDMGTFSKGFGTMGGYIAGSKTLKKYLLNKSRTWLLTGSHPPGTVAASIASLELLEKSDKLVKKLWRNTKFFKKRLKELGFDTGISETPITPVMTYDEGKAAKMSQRLWEENVYALPIVFPMVAKGKARIRTMMSADHSKEDLEFAIDKITKIGKELELIK